MYDIMDWRWHTYWEQHGPSHPLRFNFTPKKKVAENFPHRRYQNSSHTPERFYDAIFGRINWINYFSVGRSQCTICCFLLNSSAHNEGHCSLMASSGGRSTGPEYILHSNNKLWHPNGLQFAKKTCTVICALCIPPWNLFCLSLIIKTTWAIYHYFKVPC